jgi:ADP-ribosylglycohydrolase
MEAAWIAVIGTLGGVLLTAVASLLSARLTVNSQRAAAASQRLHEARNKLRDERRAAFVTYLSAYQALAHRAIEKIETPHSADDRGRFGEEERGSFSRAYQELLITADSPETVDAARAATATLWDMVQAVQSGPEAFREAEGRAQAPRRQLRAAMRDELNR